MPSRLLGGWKQISTLCEIFGERQLRRESVEDRLCVVCSRAEVNLMKAHLVLAGEPPAETLSSWP